MLTHILLDTQFADVLRRVEECTSPRDYFLFVLVRDAVMETDIGALEQIIKRVDGAAPSEEDRDLYANIIGDAIEDVMSWPDYYQVATLDITQPTVIVVAQTLYRIAVRPCGKDPQLRRDKAKAMDIIFQRTGGKKTKPVKEDVQLRFTDPDWLQALPEGEIK